MTANPSKTPPLVWVVDSAYTGELHARIGLAERLGYGYSLIPLPTGDASAYGDMLRQRYRQEGYGHTTPLLIITGTGEETTAEIANLRPVFAQQLFTVYLASILPDERHPRLGEYDLIASPQLSGNNIITLIGVPHQLNHENLALAYQQHADYFSTLPYPIIGVLVGGNTRYCDGFTQSHALYLAERIINISQALGGCLAITNSRRTPAPALNALLAGLNGIPHYYFDWQHIDHTFYHALLAHADLFVVTGDSLSMCSEAAFTGKPLLVDISTSATECYHREIVGGLIDYGAAKLLGEDFEPWRYIPPDPTGTVANVIQQRLMERI
ncbi:MAG: ELM1/GtrOC1 family putative glycosyltransferase [Methylovulum sp.]|nr:ELM1/GtrOC1 family putative glycosyltransferase [Methylovulum sp.]